MRRICFYTALYGNSDAKKLQHKPEEDFMPLPGDKPQEVAQPKDKKTRYEIWQENQRRFSEMQAKQDKKKAQALVDDIKRQINS